MDKENKILIAVASIVVVALSVFSFMGRPNVNLSVLTPGSGSDDQAIGTDLTLNTSSGSYTDGGDLQQNVQAMSERMTAVNQYTILQADASGNMEAVAPTALAGSWSLGVLDVSTFTQGGGMFTSSTANATETLLVTAIDTENFIDYTPNVNSTLTLPATSTMSALIPVAGDSRDYIIRNASSTAAATLTLAAGTGMDLQFTEATGGDLVLNGLDAGTLTMTRLTNTDILVLFNEYTEAD